MNHFLKKDLLWVVVPLALLLLIGINPATAQTDPTATPEGYPPPATPVEPQTGYPAGRPTITNSSAEEGYIPPPEATATTNPPAIIGENAPEATAVPTLPVSQSTVVRNRVVLWAGFLVTLFIFGLAVYGAMLMYTRARK